MRYRPVTCQTWEQKRFNGGATDRKRELGRSVRHPAGGGCNSILPSFVRFEFAQRNNTPAGVGRVVTMRNQVAHLPLARLHRHRAASLGHRHQHINNTAAKKADDSRGNHDAKRRAETQPSGLLTRDFIAKSLYNQDNGYFATKDVINDLPGPLEFRNMMGELHYRMDVKQVQGRVRWSAACSSCCCLCGLI